MTLETRIKEHALSCYKKYGFRSVTMDNLAQDLGISKKTIYQFFNDKEALINTLMEDVLQENEHCCIIDKNAAENAVHEIFLAMKMMQQTFADMKPNFLYELKKYHHATFVKFEKFKTEFLFGVIKENLTRGIEEGLYRADINVDIIAYMRIESVTMVFNETNYLNDKYSLLEIEEQLAKHFLHGIATVKGLKLIEKYSKQIFNKI